jgi:hypothetical protein
MLRPYLSLPIFLHKSGDIVEFMKTGFKGGAIPIPPGDSKQLFYNRLRKAEPNGPGWHASDDHIGFDIASHDCARADHRAAGDADARHNDGSMAQPDIVADATAMLAPPLKKSVVVRWGKAIHRPTVGHMMLCHALHRVITRVDPHVRGDRAKATDACVDDLVIACEVAIIAKAAFQHGHPWADLGPTTQFTIDEPGRGVDIRRFGEFLSGVVAEFRGKIIDMMHGFAPTDH